jgi:hypothetical protein
LPKWEVEELEKAKEQVLARTVGQTGNWNKLRVFNAGRFIRCATQNQVQEGLVPEPVKCALSRTMFAARAFDYFGFQSHVTSMPLS